MLNLICPVSVYNSAGRCALPPDGITKPYVPSNLTYPLVVVSNVVTLFETVFVITLPLNAKLSNTTEPVPFEFNVRLVLVVVLSDRRCQSRRGSSRSRKKQRQ